MLRRASCSIHSAPWPAWNLATWLLTQNIGTTRENITFSWVFIFPNLPNHTKPFFSGPRYFWATAKSSPSRRPGLTETWSKEHMLALSVINGILLIGLTHLRNVPIKRSKPRLFAYICFCISSFGLWLCMTRKNRPPRKQDLHVAPARPSFEDSSSAGTPELPAPGLVGEVVDVLKNHDLDISRPNVELSCWEENGGKGQRLRKAWQGQQAWCLKFYHLSCYSKWVWLQVRDQLNEHETSDDSLNFLQRQTQSSTHICHIWCKLGL